MNKVVLRYSVPDSFERLAIGLTAPGVTIFGRGADISFSGMAPIFLATGCCGEQQGPFWDNVSALPYTLAQAFRIASLPFYVFPPGDKDDLPLKGTIEKGGLELSKRLEAHTKIFGTKWIHVLAHSKGGLNTRYLLGQKTLETPGIGVRSVVTVDTPHTGSISGDLIAAVVDKNLLWFRWFDNPPLLAAIVAPRISDENGDGALKTQYDLSQARLRSFNSESRYFTPPGTTQIGNIIKPMVLRTVVGEANKDGSDENQDTLDGQGNVTSYRARNISIAEVRGFVGDPNSLGGTLEGAKALVATAMYNFLGRASDVKFTRIWSSTRYLVKPEANTRQFLLNDIAVTLNSQAFVVNGVTQFVPLATIVSPAAVQPGTLRGEPVGANHNSIVKGQLGDALVQFYRTLPR